MQCKILLFTIFMTHCKKHKSWHKFRSYGLGTLDLKRSCHHSRPSHMRPNKLSTCLGTEPPGLYPWLSTTLVAGSVRRGREMDRYSQWCSWGTRRESGHPILYDVEGETEQGSTVASRRRRFSIVNAWPLARLWRNPRIITIPKYQFNKTHAQCHHSVACFSVSFETK